MSVAFAQPAAICSNCRVQRTNSWATVRKIEVERVRQNFNLEAGIVILNGGVISITLVQF